jgi:hypothetical protein
MPRLVGMWARGGRCADSGAKSTRPKAIQPPPIQLHRFREKRFSDAIELSWPYLFVLLVLILKGFSSRRGTSESIQLQRGV